MAERSSANPRSRSALDNDHPARLPLASTPTSTASSTPSSADKSTVSASLSASPSRYIPTYLHPCVHIHLYTSFHTHTAYLALSPQTPLHFKFGLGVRGPIFRPFAIQGSGSGNRAV